MLLHRRHLLSASAATLLAGCHGRAGGHAGTLFVGDQRGGLKAVLEATRALDRVPYPISWSAFPNAAPLLEALNARAIDVGAGGDAPFLFALGGGARIKAIAAQRYEGPGPVLVVRGDSTLRSFADIAGRRIATPRGSVSHNLILAALEAQGRPLDAVRFAFLSPQDGQAALQSGAVDGWAIWDPYAELAVRGGARIVPGGEALVPSYALLVASDAAIADKRALLADFRRRLNSAWAWGGTHGDAYAEVLHRETGVALDVWRTVNARTHRLPAPIDATLIADQQKTADRYLRAGILTRPLDVRAGFATDFT